MVEERRQDLHEVWGKSGGLNEGSECFAEESDAFGSVWPVGSWDDGEFYVILRIFKEFLEKRFGLRE